MNKMPSQVLKTCCYGDWIGLHESCVSNPFFSPSQIASQSPILVSFSCSPHSTLVALLFCWRFSLFTLNSTLPSSIPWKNISLLSIKRQEKHDDKEAGNVKITKSSLAQRHLQASKFYSTKYLHLSCVITVRIWDEHQRDTITLKDFNCWQKRWKTITSPCLKIQTAGLWANFIWKDSKGLYKLIV